MRKKHTCLLRPLQVKVRWKINSKAIKKKFEFRGILRYYTCQLIWGIGENFFQFVKLVCVLAHA